MAFVRASLAVEGCQCHGFRITGNRTKHNMAQHTDPNGKIPDIGRRNLTESGYRIINMLSGQGRKRKRANSTKRGGKQKGKGRTCEVKLRSRRK